MTTNITVLHDDGTEEHLGTCRTTPKQKMKEIAEKYFPDPTDHLTYMAGFTEASRACAIKLMTEFYIWYENEQRLIEAKRRARG